MENLLFRMTAAGIIFFLQAYCFASFADGGHVVDFVLMGVISWVIISGFEKVWPYVVVMGVAIDLLAFDRVGENVILFILVAYFVSFISRRVLIEGKGWSLLLITFIIIGATFFSNIYFSVILFWKIDGATFFSSGWATFFQSILGEAVWNIVFFYPAYWIVSRIEKRLSFYERAVNIK